MKNNIPFRFYGITDRKRMIESLFLSHLDRAVKAGLRALQIREKDLSPRALYELTDKIRTISATRRVRIFINDRVDIAMALDLDGVHLSTQSMPTYNVRKLVGPDKLIGVSTHDLHEAIHAENEGADFIVIGPIGETRSKPKGHAVLSEKEFEIIREEVKIPIFVLGGVQTNNISHWLQKGVHGAAGISLLMDDENLEERFSNLKSTLGSL